MNPCLRLAAILCACLAAAGCNSAARHAVNEQPAAAAAPNVPAPVAAPALPGLPAPDELAALLGPAPRSASYTPPDLLRQAEAFEAGLPHQRVTATANGAAFDPNWRRATADPADLAYAMYAFTVKGYDGNPQLYSGWTTPPPDWGDSFVALANWGKSRWDWYHLDGAGAASLPGTAQYIDFGGNLLACVLMIDTNPAELDWLRLGSLAPQPALTASLDTGLTPLTVDFDAAGSSDPDGDIAEYRWDPQGDGSFEVSTGTDPHYSFEYASAGTFQAAVRVVDNYGVHADAAVTVSTVDEVSFSFGTAEASDTGMRVFGCSDGDLLVFINNFIIDPVDWNIVQARLSLTGEPRFVKAWTEAGRVDLFDAVADAQGNYYVCGQDTAHGSYDGLLQKWSQDGELLWSKVVGTANDAEVFYALCLSGDSIFVCGDWYSYDLLRHFGILLRFDLDGNKLWDYSVIAPQDCFLKDIAYHATEQAGTPSLYVCGEFNPSGSDTDAFFATFDTDGNLYSGKRWGDSGSSRETATTVTVRGILSPSAYVAGSIVNPGTRSFIAQPGVASVVLSGAASQFLQAADLLDLTLLARHWGGGTQGLALATFDSSLNLVGQREFNTATGSPSSTDLAPYGQSAFVITGLQLGSLPAEVPLTLSAETSGLAWTSVSAPVGNPNFTVTDTATTLTDHPGYALNRGSGFGDALLFLRKW